MLRRFLKFLLLHMFLFEVLFLNFSISLIPLSFVSAKPVSGESVYVYVTLLVVQLMLHSSVALCLIHHFVVHM